jgi:hypothetical protein
MAQIVIFDGRHFSDKAALWRTMNDQHALTPFSFGMLDLERMPCLSVGS